VAWLERLTGMIQVGLAADWVVLDRDVIDEGHKALLDAGFRLAMMDGEVTYSPTGTGSL
jgi:predicted amidohydrolase YtcJ